MKRLLLPMALLLACFALACKDTDNKITAPDALTWKVQVKCEDSVNHSAVANIRVIVQSEEGYETERMTTNADGKTVVTTLRSEREPLVAYLIADPTLTAMNYARYVGRLPAIKQKDAVTGEALYYFTVPMTLLP